MEKYTVDVIRSNKYIFFTGKGGVGKTSIACATAVELAELGRKVMLVSTDPASNLQDVFDRDLNNKGVVIKEIPNLNVANFDPMKAAEEYRESVIKPYRGKLPESVIKNMEEQLSGSCTVEIAAFNEFTNFITNPRISEMYEHIVFDTAPTGHTLRMLQLPAAWSDFIDENTHGTSCLGQLSGLEEKKDVYKEAVKTLANGEQTKLILVARAEKLPLKEATRASQELNKIGIKNQLFVINGVLDSYDDDLSESIYKKERRAINDMSPVLKNLPIFKIPLRPYNIEGLESIRNFLSDEAYKPRVEVSKINRGNHLNQVIDDLYLNDKKIIFTMGKGGVGKTTVASSIALGLAKKGKKVHLTTTDPANHLDDIFKDHKNISVSSIDEKEEHEKYKRKVLNSVKNEMSAEDRAYIEEDLKSPCTQEIAVFRAFAEVVDKSDEEVVIIDTAPTGHTILLLESTQSYHQEIERSHGEVPESIKKLLPKLRDSSHTEVIIVTLAQPTPVFEAERLEKDLKRASIRSNWWIINASLQHAETTNEVLKAKSTNEIKWINRVSEISKEKFALIEWLESDVEGKVLERLIG